MATTLRDMVAAARNNVREVTVEALADDLKQGDSILLVDVREPHEYAKSHIAGAVNIPRGMLELRADPASPIADAGLVSKRDARVVLYCMQSPSARSLLSAETLGRMGYTNVAAIAGGLKDWSERSLPVESDR